MSKKTEAQELLELLQILSPGLDAMEEYLSQHMPEGPARDLFLRARALRREFEEIYEAAGGTPEEPS